MAEKVALVVMARVPQPGRVKTRLQPALSGSACADLYGAFLTDVLQAMRKLPGVDVGCWVTPWEEMDQVRAILPSGVSLRPQRGETLADRMIQCFESLFSEGYRKIVMRNSDSPTLPVERVSRAFQSLSRHDVVVGPDQGGGYYLVGLREPRAFLFRDIAMSSEGMRAATVRLAESRGLSVDQLDPWLDVDEPEDLDTLREELSRSPADRDRCPATVRALTQIDTTFR